jgi:hypothetical protein
LTKSFNKAGKNAALVTTATDSGGSHCGIPWLEPGWRCAPGLLDFLTFVRLLLFIQILAGCTMRLRRFLVRGFES